MLILRVVFGIALAAHGSQKLFGWFGGHGLSGTTRFFGQLGYRAPLAMAVLAGVAELGGGLLLALGLVTPLAAAAIAIVMLNAIVAVHRHNGFWNADGGWEMNLFVLTTAIAVTAAGALRFSLDHAIGWEHAISGPWWALAVLAAAAAVSTVTLGLRSAPISHLRRAA
jgi:putative oxidoreductase